MSLLDGDDAADGISQWHCEQWQSRQLTGVRGLTSRHDIDSHVSIHAQRVFDLLHTYCHVVYRPRSTTGYHDGLYTIVYEPLRHHIHSCPDTSAAIKREQVDGYLQSKAYMNP